MAIDTMATDLPALMIGCGNMGGALLKGWKKADGITVSVIAPSKPDLGDTPVYGSAAELPNTKFSLIIIAVKPQMIPDVVVQYKDLFDQADTVLSMAAGVTIANLEQQVGPKAIIRIMPNMPSAVAKGLTGVLANDRTDASIRALIEAMLSFNGEFLWIDNEDRLDRFTAIAGSGPGYFFEVLRQFTHAAEGLGFSPEDARKLAIQTVLGTAAMAAQSDQSLEDLRKSVTSKNGVTQAGLEQLMRGDELQSLFEDTLDAAYKRSIELR